MLGSATPLPGSLFDGARRWLETVVDGAALSPRRQLAAVPYAMRATVADVALSGGDTAWTVNGQDVYRPTGNVGIGTNAPARSLHVQSDELSLPASALQNDDLVIESTDAAIGLYSNTAGTTGSGLSLGEISGGALNNRWDLFRRTTSGGNGLNLSYFDGVVGTSVFYASPDGKIGLGTSSPTSTLTVEGDALADSYQADTSLGSAVAPAVGGVYADNVVYAWARVRGDGVIEASYGVQSVTRIAAGYYRVTLRRSLQSGQVVPMAIAYSANDIVVARIASASTNVCDVRTDMWIQGNGQFSATDYRFLVQVVGRP